ncbi:hypothetical protein ElyMa_000309300, partial [Elysia marginata]
DSTSVFITALSLPGKATSPGTGRNPKRSQGLVVRLGQGRTLDIVAPLYQYALGLVRSSHRHSGILADCALGGKLSRWQTLRAEPPQRYRRIVKLVVEFVEIEVVAATEAVAEVVVSLPIAALTTLLIVKVIIAASKVLVVVAVAATAVAAAILPATPKMFVVVSSGSISISMRSTSGGTNSSSRSSSIRSHSSSSSSNIITSSSSSNSSNSCRSSSGCYCSNSIKRIISKFNSGGAAAVV